MRCTKLNIFENEENDWQLQFENLANMRVDPD